MIYLTKNNIEKKRFLLNQRLIEQIQESNSGTLITMQDGKRIIVEETLERVIQEVQQYEVEILLLAQKKKEEGISS